MKSQSVVFMKVATQSDAMPTSNSNFTTKDVPAVTQQVHCVGFFILFYFILSPINGLVLESNNSLVRLTL